MKEVTREPGAKLPPVFNVLSPASFFGLKPFVGRVALGLQRGDFLIVLAFALVQRPYALATASGVGRTD